MFDIDKPQPLGVTKWNATTGKKGMYIQVWCAPPEGIPETLAGIDKLISLFGDSRVLLGDVKSLLWALREVPEVQLTETQRTALKPFRGLFLDAAVIPEATGQGETTAATEYPEFDDPAVQPMTAEDREG